MKPTPEPGALLAAIQALDEAASEERQNLDFLRKTRAWDEIEIQQCERLMGDLTTVAHWLHDVKLQAEKTFRSPG